MTNISLSIFTYYEKNCTELIEYEKIGAFSSEQNMISVVTDAFHPFAQLSMGTTPGTGRHRSLMSFFGQAKKEH